MSNAVSQDAVRLERRLVRSVFVCTAAQETGRQHGHCAQASPHGEAEGHFPQAGVQIDAEAHAGDDDDEKKNRELQEDPQNFCVTRASSFEPMRGPPVQTSAAQFGQ